MTDTKPEVSAPEWHVGQEVILRATNHGRSTKDSMVTIARVGRKYVYVVRYGREVAFEKEGGREVTAGNYADRIGTAEHFAAWDAWAVAEKRVNESTRSYSWTRNLSTETLTRIADLIEGGE